MATRRTRRLQARIIGRSCVLGMALCGCSRQSVEVAHDDSQSRAAAVERASEAISRSREELIAQEVKSKSTIQASASRLDDASDESPSKSIRSRWTALSSKWRPGGSLESDRGKKDYDPAADPFLAAAVESRKTTEEQRRAGPSSPRDKTIDKAIDELLKQNAPTGIDEHLTASGKRPSSEKTVARAVPERTAKKHTVDAPSTGERKVDRRVAQIPATDTTSGHAIPVAGTRTADGPRSTARPFPTAEKVDRLASSSAAAGPRKTLSPPTESAPIETAAAPQAAAPPKHPLAAAGSQRDGTRRSESPVQAKIEALLAEAHDAADAGNSARALDRVSEAERVAAIHKHHFASGEETPADVRQQLTGRSEKSLLARGLTEGSRFEAPAGDYSSGFDSEKSPRGQEHRISTAPTQPSLVANHRAAVTPAGGWPTETAYADSNELWKAAAVRSEANDVSVVRTAKAEFVPAPFVQAAEGETIVSREQDSDLETVRLPELPAPEVTSSGPSLPPLVELGEATRSIPASLARLAAADAPSYVGGPPLAPPPLSIGSDFARESHDTDQEGTLGTPTARFFWFAAGSALVLGLLVLFRRRVYGAQDV